MDDLRGISNQSVSDNEIFWDWVSKEIDIKGSDDNAHLRFSPQRQDNKEFIVRNSFLIVHRVLLWVKLSLSEIVQRK